MAKRTSAERQAAKLLELYGHEREFDVEFADDDEAAAVKAAFERLGCTVRQEPFKPLLHVTCAGPLKN